MPRPHGSKNKVTKDVKKIISNIIENNIDRIEIELSHLEGKNYIDCIIKLLDYVIPKAKEEPINTSFEPPKIIVQLSNEEGIKNVHN